MLNSKPCKVWTQHVLLSPRCLPLIWKQWFARKSIFTIHLASLADIGFWKTQCTLESVKVSGLCECYPPALEGRCACARVWTLVYSCKSKLQAFPSSVYCLKSEVIQSVARLMNRLQKSTPNYLDLSLTPGRAGLSGVSRDSAWMQIYTSVCCQRWL